MSRANNGVGDGGVIPGAGDLATIAGHGSSMAVGTLGSPGAATAVAAIAARVARMRHWMEGILGKLSVMKFGAGRVSEG